MALSIGIDIVDVERFQRRLSAEPTIIDELFIESELTFCRSASHAYRRLAACLAVKEAFLKATGIGLREGLVFRDIEVIYDAAGTSGLRLHGKLSMLLTWVTAAECRVSSAFTSNLACAVVLLPQKGRAEDESFRLLRGPG